MKDFQQVALPAETNLRSAVPLRVVSDNCSPKEIHETRQKSRCDDSTQISTLMALFDASSPKQTYRPDSSIMLHGYPADAIYLIVSGTVRCCTISEDGERQIFRFAKKGEFLGLSDIDNWHFTAEAVDHVTVKHVPRAVLEQTLAVDIQLRFEIRRQVLNQLENREKQLLSLVLSKAPDRLFKFLSDFAASRSSTGYVALPMCRRDIADHLGMSVETVSRAFGHLKLTGRIGLSGAEKFQILDTMG